MRKPIKINIKPLSVNEAWKGRRIRTDAYKQYQHDLGFLLPVNVKLPEPPYEIYLKWGFSSKSSDWDNPIKPTQDIIAKKYGFDDKLIKRAIIETEIVPKGQEYFKFSINQLIIKNHE